MAAAIKAKKLTTSEEYLAHAEECVRLANTTNDEFLKRELLSLRQNYLKTAERLRNQQGSGSCLS